MKRFVFLCLTISSFLDISLLPGFGSLWASVEKTADTNLHHIIHTCQLTRYTFRQNVIITFVALVVVSRRKGREKAVDEVTPTHGCCFLREYPCCLCLPNGLFGVAVKQMHLVHINDYFLLDTVGGLGSGLETGDEGAVT